jgi:hypothetical protein
VSPSGAPGALLAPAAATAVAGGGTALAGCGAGPAPADQAAPGAKGPATVVFWCRLDPSDWQKLEAPILEYRKRHPQIKIDDQNTQMSDAEFSPKLLAAFASGAAPDAFWSATRWLRPCAPGALGEHQPPPVHLGAGAEGSDRGQEAVGVTARTAGAEVEAHEVPPAAALSGERGSGYATALDLSAGAPAPLRLTCRRPGGAAGPVVAPSSVPVYLVHARARTGFRPVCVPRPA